MCCDQLDIWKEIYLTPDKIEDPHTLFAERLGIDRYKAKILCYKIMFQLPFLTSILVDLKPKHVRSNK